jgi:hypothetical protein
VELAQGFAPAPIQLGHPICSAASDMASELFLVGASPPPSALFLATASPSSSALFSGGAEDDEQDDEDEEEEAEEEGSRILLATQAESMAFTSSSIDVPTISTSSSGSSWPPPTWPPGTPLPRTCGDVMCKFFNLPFRQSRRGFPGTPQPPAGSSRVCASPLRSQRTRTEKWTHPTPFTSCHKLCYAMGITGKRGRRRGAIPRQSSRANCTGGCASAMRTRQIHEKQTSPAQFQLGGNRFSQHTLNNPQHTIFL